MRTDPLEALEEQVREASARIGGLREENAELRTRVEELERELDAHRGTSGAARDRQREEIRRRVERLAARLAELVEA